LPGKGPEIVITDRAILNFDNAEREMQLSAIYPGVSEQDVRAETGWKLRRAAQLEQVSPPSVQELRLIREELDPSGMYR
jgi:glutaconate CoA-transferase subunit B